MARILITGARGFVGRHLLPELAGRHDLYGLVRGDPPSDVPPGTQWIRADLAAPLDPAVLPERLDAIIHLAQSRHYREFPERADDVFAVNVQGTFHLLEYGRRIGCSTFVLASSGGVYGYGYETLQESDPVRPLDFYLSSKFCAELLAGNYHAYFHTIALRFFFVYGPGQHGMLIPRLAERVRARETVTIEGNPGRRINPIFVEDAVRVFEPCLSLDGSDLFNVAGDEVVTITGLLRAIQHRYGHDSPVRYAATPDAGDLIGDNSRMKQVLGVSPKTTLAEGLRRALPV